MTLRLWPGNPAPSGTSAGAEDALTLGTQFSVSAACDLLSLWWYSPAGAAALPQVCGIWDAGSQALVCEDASPLWLDPGGDIASPGDGWVRCDFTAAAVTLAAGPAYVASVWQDAPGVAWYIATDGYFTTGAGRDGIADGALYAPDSASSAGGQGCYDGGGAWEFPGTSGAGAAYYADVEVSEVVPVPAVVQATNADGLFPGPLTAGNSVVLVGVAYNGGAAISSSAPTIDGAGVTGSKLQDGNSPLPNTALVYEAIWLLPAVAAGGTQVSLTFTATGGATEQTLIGLEVSGLGASPLADGEPSTGNGDNSGPASSGSAGPVSGTSDLIVGATVGYALSMSAPSSPWTGIAGNSDFAYAGYQIAAEPGGSYDFSTSFTGSGDWVAGVVAITSAPAPAAALPQQCSPVPAIMTTM